MVDSIRNTTIPLKGAKVLILEQNASRSSHAQEVSANAKRAVSNTETSFKSNEFKFPDEASSIKDYLIKSKVSSYDLYTQDFKDINAQKDRPNAINISESLSESYFLKHFINNKSYLFNMATAEEKQKLFENPNDPNSDLKIVESEEYIDQSFQAGKTEIDEAKSKLEAEVQRLKENRIAVVACISNQGGRLATLQAEYPNIQFEKNEGQNFLGEIKGVVLVGASKEYGPLTDYSSYGPNMTFSTTVPNADLDKKGTSLTSPAIAAAIGTLIANGMTPDEAIAFLKKKGRSMADGHGNAYTYVAKEALAETATGSTAIASNSTEEESAVGTETGKDVATPSSSTTPKNTAVVPTLASNTESNTTKTPPSPNVRKLAEGQDIVLGFSNSGNATQNWSKQSVDILFAQENEDNQSVKKEYQKNGNVGLFSGSRNRSEAITYDADNGKANVITLGKTADNLDADTTTHVKLDQDDTLNIAKSNSVKSVKDNGNGTIEVTFEEKGGIKYNADSTQKKENTTHTTIVTLPKDSVKKIIAHFSDEIEKALNTKEAS